VIIPLYAGFRKDQQLLFQLQPTTLDPEGMNLIGEIIFDMLADTDVTAAGGLTLGADPIANALAVISYQKGKPIRSFIVRKDVKGHGTKSAIEGNVKPGERLLSSTMSLPPRFHHHGHRTGQGSGTDDRPRDCPHRP